MKSYEPQLPDLGGCSVTRNQAEIVHQSLWQGGRLSFRGDRYRVHALIEPSGPVLPLLT
jgi:hypothetical protein